MGLSISFQHSGFNTGLLQQTAELSPLFLQEIDSGDYD
jgi:hypothetical protein